MIDNYCANSIKFAFFALSITFFSCLNDRKVDTGSEKLNSKINSAETFLFNFDTIKVDTLRVEKLIDFESSLLVENEVFINNILDLAKTDKYVYLFSRDYPFVYKFDNNGHFLESYKSKGAGPSELNSILKVAKNDSGIFVLDNKNSRINIFDHDLNFDTSFTTKKIDFFIHSSDLIASENNLIGQAPSGEVKLMSIFTLTDKSRFDHVSYFQEELIPKGMQPKVVNNYVADINNENRIATSYFGLPYVFIYDSTANLKTSLILESDYFSENKVSLKPVIENGALIRVPKFISNILWISNKYLLVVNRNIISVFILEENKYFLKNRFAFTRQLLNNSIDQISIRMLDIDKDYLYLSSNFDNGVYIVKLSDLTIKN